MLWGLSYREFYRKVLVATEQHVERHNRDVRRAWMTEAFHRMKRPNVDKFLIGNKPTQTVEEQMAVVRRLAAAFGGQIRKVEMHG